LFLNISNGLTREENREKEIVNRQLIFVPKLNPDKCSNVNNYYKNYFPIFCFHPTKNKIPTKKAIPEICKAHAK